MDVFVQYPFEAIVAIIVIIVALTKNLGWAVFTMYVLIGIAYIFKVGGFEQFAFGIIAGVIANEITHLIRSKKDHSKRDSDG